MKTVEIFQARIGNVVELKETMHKTYFVVKGYRNGQIFVSNEFENLRDAKDVFLDAIDTCETI